MDRLHRWIGLSDTALNRFTSNLTECSQFVQLGINRSETVPLQLGVPQGSVLGPTRFSFYIISMLTMTPRFILALSLISPLPLQLSRLVC